MFLSWQPRSDEYLIGILFDIVICCDKKKKEFYWGRSTNNFAVCSFQFRMLSMVQRLEAEAMFFFYLHSHQLAPGRSLGLCDNPSFLSTVWFSCRRSLPLTLSSSSPSGLVPGKAAAGGSTVEHLPLAPTLGLARLESRRETDTGIQPWMSVPVRFLARLQSGLCVGTWDPALCLYDLVVETLTSTLKYGWDG